MSGVLALGIGGPAVVLHNDTAFSGAVSPAPASVSCQVNSAGHVIDDGGLSYLWLLGGTASNFEIFATLVSGTLTSGTTGSWLNLGATQTWNVTRTPVGTKTADITLQIRPVGGAVIASADITLTAQVDV